MSKIYKSQFDGIDFLESMCFFFQPICLEFFTSILRFVWIKMKLSERQLWESVDKFRRTINYSRFETDVGYFYVWVVRLLGRVTLRYCVSSSTRYLTISVTNFQLKPFVRNIVRRNRYYTLYGPVRRVEDYAIVKDNGGDEYLPHTRSKRKIFFSFSLFLSLIELLSSRNVSLLHHHSYFATLFEVLNNAFSYESRFPH